MTRPRPAPIAASFPCAVCDGSSTVVLLPPGTRDPRSSLGGTVVPIVRDPTDDMWRLSLDGPMQITMGPIRRHEEVAAALAAGDPRALAAIDPEYASFWCPRCRACYCREHLPGIMEFDEGFYDATYATCPAGHRVMIDD